MKYKIKATSIFNKDLKKASKRGLDLDKLSLVINTIANGKQLDKKYRDHSLINNKKYKNVRECHIEPDWLLIYSINEKYVILELIRTGSHSDLFI